MGGFFESGKFAEALMEQIQKKERDDKKKSSPAHPPGQHKAATGDPLPDTGLDIVDLSDVGDGADPFESTKTTKKAKKKASERQK